VLGFVAQLFRVKVPEVIRKFAKLRKQVGNRGTNFRRDGRRE
jgi:hypothetical protein